MKVCGVIPAAGQGSRLGGVIPKILLPITKNKTVWSILRDKLLNVADHLHIIVSPTALLTLQTAMDIDIRSGLVSLSVQSQPIGMGDAIFRGYNIWSQAEKIVVVWGDQVFVSSDTLKHSMQMHTGSEKTIVLPLIEVASPYVEYIFDDNSLLKSVKQTREGDICAPRGLADVGTFILSVKDLLSAWQNYNQTVQLGSHTQEINFLPFLPFLVARGWQVKQNIISNHLEARGINTMADLKYFQNLYE